MSSDYVKRHFHDRLVGKTIDSVREMDKSDMEAYGWYTRDVGVIVVFTDGTFMIPMMDPEGNGPGFLDIYTEADLPWIDTTV